MKKQTHSIFWLLSCVRARIPSLLALLLLSMANAELGVLFALGTRGVVNAAASGEAAALLRASGVQAALIAALLLTLTGCARCETLFRQITSATGNGATLESFCTRATRKARSSTRRSFSTA